MANKAKVPNNREDEKVVMEDGGANNPRKVHNNKQTKGVITIKTIITIKTTTTAPTITTTAASNRPWP